MIKIVQPLNNNVVMGYDRKKGEVIIIGTGIGFRAKKGDQVDESKIQKMFITGENKQLLEMIGAIPPEYFELVEVARRIHRSLWFQRRKMILIRSVGLDLAQMII